MFASTFVALQIVFALQIARRLRPLVLIMLLLAVRPLALAQTHWVGTWATANMALPPKVDDGVVVGAKPITIRETAHISQGGSQVRVTLTNELGTAPLTIDAAHVALTMQESRILKATDHTLTFAGRGSVTIPAGEAITSDALVMKLPIFSDVVVSLAIPQQPIETLTGHDRAFATTYLSQGDETAAEELTHPTKTAAWYLIKNLQVDGSRRTAAMVALGDSLTDGYNSTPDTNRRWPDVFAAILGGSKKTGAVAVQNVSISGNRVLTDRIGLSALHRLDRDALTAPGVKWIVLLEGINDIGRNTDPYHPADAPVTAEQIVAGMQKIVERAHARGLKVYGGTLLPYRGSHYFSAEGEQMRQTVNAFIRTSGSFDAVIDFDKAMQDPEHPEQLRKKYDSGDHLHPSDAGYAAMAAAIDLKLFR